MWGDSVSVSWGHHCLSVLLGEDEWSFRAEGLRRPGSAFGDMTLGASADLIPVTALSGGPTSPRTRGHP